MRKSFILPSLALLTLSPTTVFAQESFTGNFAVTSNYIWRGVTQSDDKASLSLGADYTNDTGFYVGTWAASVDFNDDTNFEYDIYAGYQTEINDINFDFGYLYYGYQGEDDLAFSEVYVRGTYQGLTLALSTLVDNDTGVDFADTNYFEASYGFALPLDLTLDIHGGYYQFEHGDNYQDYNVALSKSGFSLMFSTLKGNDELEDNLIAFSYSGDFSF